MTYSLNKPNGVPRVVQDSNLCSLIVAALLSIDVANGDEQGPPCESKLTAFHALSAPNISVSTYMTRLAHYCFASNAVQLLAFYYMRRAAKADPRLEPTSRSVHRLLITCMVVAAKYLDDIAYNLSYYAKVGGLPVSELAYLELSLLTLLKFNLHISVEDFHSLEQDLLTELENAPPTEAVETARKALYRAGVRKTGRNAYFVTMHEGEAPLALDTHSNPRKRVLPSPEPEVEEPIDVSSDLDDELFEDFSKMHRFDSSSTITSDIMSPETSTCSLSPVAVRSIMCDVRPERTHRRVSFPKSQMYQHILCSPPTPSSKCCRAIEQYAQFAKFEQEVEATLCR